MTASKYTRSKAASILWRAFLTFAAIVSGSAGVYRFYKAVKGGGEVLVLFLGIPVFALCACVSFGFLLFIGRRLTDWARLLLASIFVLLTYVSVEIPQREEAAVKAAHSAELEREENRQRELYAQFKAQLADNLKTMETIRHAPPDIAPQELQIQRAGTSVTVRNISDKELFVKAAIVFARGPQWERCTLSVYSKCYFTDKYRKHCTTKPTQDQVSQGYKTAENSRPFLAPGESLSFEGRSCTNYTGSAVEFRLFEASGVQREVFKSDSAFVPETPEIWQWTWLYTPPPGAAEPASPEKIRPEIRAEATNRPPPTFAPAPQKDAAALRTQFDAKLADNLRAMEYTPHAPPGTVPDELEVTRTGNSIRVGNASVKPLRVRVNLVLAHGPQWERCKLSVARKCYFLAAERCTLTPKPGQESASYKIVQEPRPILQPGEKMMFEGDCQFDDGKVEFHLLAPETDSNVLFKSDSAFVPDIPKLWE